MMFGWLRNIWIFTSRMNWSVIYYSWSNFFSITLRAQINPVYFYLARYTLPYLPFPSYFNLVKSSTITFLGLVLEVQGIYFVIVSSRAKWALFDSKVGSITWLLFNSGPLYLFKKEGICLWFSIFYSLLSFFTKLPSLGEFNITNSYFLKSAWEILSIVNTSLNLNGFFEMFFKNSFLLLEFSSGKSLLEFSPMTRLWVIEWRVGRGALGFCKNPYCIGGGDLNSLFFLFSPAE